MRLVRDSRSGVYDSNERNRKSAPQHAGGLPLFAGPQPGHRYPGVTAPLPSWHSRSHDRGGRAYIVRHAQLQRMTSPANSKRQPCSAMIPVMTHYASAAEQQLAHTSTRRTHRAWSQEPASLLEFQALVLLLRRVAQRDPPLEAGHVALTLRREVGHKSVQGSLNLCESLL